MSFSFRSTNVYLLMFAFMVTAFFGSSCTNGFRNSKLLPDQTQYSELKLMSGDSVSFQDLVIQLLSNGSLFVSRDGTVLWGIAANESCATNCSLNFSSDGTFSLSNNGVTYWDAGQSGLTDAQLILSQTAPFLRIQKNDRTYWSTGKNLNWFSVLDPYGDYGKNRPGPQDFLQLFSDEYQWPTTLSQIHIMKFYAQFFMSAPDEVLVTVFEFLNKHHIALAIETGVVTRRNDCGSGVEGMIGPNESLSIASRISALGGNLAFIAMDEPLFFAHYNTTTGTAPNISCQYSIPDLAANIFTNIKIYQKYFPDILVGDIEPFNQLPSDQWLTDLGQFYDAYQSVAGQPFSFVQDDALFQDVSWQSRIMPLRSFLSDKKIPYGIIRDNTLPATSSKEWVNGALTCAKIYNSIGVPAPDQNVFQTWSPYPETVLPETTPGTMTNFVKTYFLTIDLFSSWATGA